MFRLSLLVGRLSLIPWQKEIHGHFCTIVDLCRNRGRSEHAGEASQRVRTWPAGSKPQANGHAQASQVPRRTWPAGSTEGAEDDSRVSPEILEHRATELLLEPATDELVKELFE